MHDTSIQAGCCKLCGAKLNLTSALITHQRLAVLPVILGELNNRSLLIIQHKPVSQSRITDLSVSLDRITPRASSFNFNPFCRFERFPGFIQKSYSSNFINPSWWGIYKELKQVLLLDNESCTFSVTYCLWFIQTLNKKAPCLGQASNTSDYTRRVDVQAAKANFEASCDVEAAACVPKALGRLQWQNTGTISVNWIRPDTLSCPVNTDIWHQDQSAVWQKWTTQRCPTSNKNKTEMKSLPLSLEKTVESRLFSGWRCWIKMLSLCSRWVMASVCTGEQTHTHFNRISHWERPRWESQMKNSHPTKGGGGRVIHTDSFGHAPMSYKYCSNQKQSKR